MISELHYKILENANRELSASFSKLGKARANPDLESIKQAEMNYFHALQHLYAAVQDAVAENSHQPSVSISDRESRGTL